MTAKPGSDIWQPCVVVPYGSTTNKRAVIALTHIVEGWLADEEGDGVPAVPDQVDDVVPGGALDVLPVDGQDLVPRHQLVHGGATRGYKSEIMEGQNLIEWIQYPSIHRPYVIRTAN